MLNLQHHVLTPRVSRKRKEREGFDSLKPSSTTSASETTGKAAEPFGSSNRLLAGYLAHEFLNHGTLFGQRLDSDRAEPVDSVPSPTSVAESRSSSDSGAAPPSPSPAVMKHQCYAEVASLLKMDGSHIPGIINPTQLARLMQM